MIRTGFVFNTNETVWLGGQTYFRNLLSALAGLPERRLQPVVLTGAALPPGLLENSEAIEERRLSCLRRGSRLWLARRVLRHLSSRDTVLEHELLKAGIELLSHSGHLGPNARVPTLAWIPDLQHVRLPEFFSASELRRRNRVYAQVCRYATRIIVSSHCARADLVNFSSEAQEKSRVLQFVASVQNTDALPARAILEEKYRFAGKYFFLPNQFWAHKNHRVVLDALAILRSRGLGFTVLATGQVRDDRRPKYFSELMTYARAIGVDQSFRVLGLVPRDDVMGLMWNAVAVINPSRFEGWSTTVEEAKSLGVRALLSDIDVHREQAAAGAAYFHPDDPEGLAKLMHEFQIQDDPESSALRAEQARRQLPFRKATFARQFEDYALECTASHRSEAGNT